MKKLIIKIFLTLSIFLSFGCNYEVYYKRVTDLSKVRAKTNMKPFEQINDPIVITMPVYEKMALFGNESMGSYDKRAGDMFVVYDWENNEIHDWCFFEGNHGWSNFRAVEMGTPVKYYDAGEKIGCLSSDGKLTTYKNPVMGTFTNLNNNQKVKSRYGILNTDGKNVNGKYAYRINIFDSETGIVNDEQIKLDCDYSYFFYPFADEEGNYWICNINDDKNWLNKIDGKNNRIEKYFLENSKEESIKYYVQETFKNYIVLEEADYSKKKKYCIDNIFLFDVKNKQKIQINLNSNPNYSISYFISVSVNDDLYAIFLADRDCDETEWREAIELYKFNFEKKELIYINYHPNFDMTETVYSRGSRIYFLNSRNIQNFICTYYDTETGKWGEEFTITQEEILKM